MVKSDFEILVTICVVATILCLLDFGMTSKNIEQMLGDIKNIKATQQYKDFEAFKVSEESFWAELKGTTINSGTFDFALNSDQTKGSAVDSDAAKQANGNFQKFVEKKENQIEPPVKFLLVGDSMMLLGFGPTLENTLLNYRDVSVVREGRYSTGLNRIDYFNWFTYTDELITNNKPDILIVMMGANDGQDIVDTSGNVYQLGSSEWETTYRERVYQYLLATTERVKKIYWVGHPIAGTENFTWKFSIMNAIYKSESAKFVNVTYVDTWDRFSVNGAFSQSIPDDNGLWQIAKYSDGVHVTDFGGGVMTNLVMKEVLKDVHIVDKNAPVEVSPTPTL